VAHIKLFQIYEGIETFDFGDSIRLYGKKPQLHYLVEVLSGNDE
jgi:hypothetical protein